MDQTQSQSIIEYGMNVVGESLGYIRRGDIEGLINKIHEKISAKFGINLNEEENQRSLKSILEGAAESLDNSEIALWRKEYAARIFKELGLAERAEKSQREAEEYYYLFIRYHSIFQEIYFN